MVDPRAVQSEHGHTFTVLDVVHRDVADYLLHRRHASARRTLSSCHADGPSVRVGWFVGWWFGWWWSVVAGAGWFGSEGAAVAVA